MDIRACSISFASRPRRHTGHLITNPLARPFLLLLFPTRRPWRECQLLLRDQPEPFAIPLVNLRVFMSGCCLRDTHFNAALLCQHGPGDPRQLVGKSCGQNVRMQALSGASEPAPEAVLRPARRPQQNDPGCLHEECAQVTVAALGDAPENGSVSGRHLLRDEADPEKWEAAFQHPPRSFARR
jgi:hypothetical protein